MVNVKTTAPKSASTLLMVYKSHENEILIVLHLTWVVLHAGLDMSGQILLVEVLLLVVLHSCDVIRLLHEHLRYLLDNHCFALQLGIRDY